MQYSWRITRYNPDLRDSEGREIPKKRTSNRASLTVEDLYINAIRTFMEDLEIFSLQVFDIEKYADLTNIEEVDMDYSNELKNLFYTVVNGNHLGIDEVGLLSRLVFRGHLWCKLQRNEMMFVHFGYDGNLYIGSSKMCSEAIAKINESGLFVEQFPSPYRVD